MDTALATATYEVQNNLCVKVTISKTFDLSIELLKNMQQIVCFDSKQIKSLKPSITEDFNLKLMIYNKEMCTLSMEAWAKIELILDCVRKDIETVRPYLNDPEENAIIKDRHLLRGIIATWAQNEYINKIGLYCKACYTWSRQYGINDDGFCTLCTNSYKYILSDENMPVLEHTEDCIRNRRNDCLVIAKCALLNINERQLATILLNSRLGCLGISKNDIMGNMETEMAQKCVDGLVYHPLTQLLLHKYRRAIDLPQYSTELGLCL